MGAEPLAKRPKLDHPEIPPEERLCICNAVRDVVEGRNVRPRVWQLLSQGNRRHFEFVFQVGLVAFPAASYTCLFVYLFVCMFVCLHVCLFVCFGAGIL